MNEFFSLELGEREFSELNSRGYLKLKIQVPRERLSDFDNAFISKKHFHFRYHNQQIATVLTSVDVAKEVEGKICKVFLGFAPV
jgi:hypothetical protein